MLETQERFRECKNKRGRGVGPSYFLMNRNWLSPCMSIRSLRRVSLSSCRLKIDAKPFVSPDEEKKSSPLLSEGALFSFLLLWRFVTDCVYSVNQLIAVGREELSDEEEEKDDYPFESYSDRMLYSYVLCLPHCLCFFFDRLAMFSEWFRRLVYREINSGPSANSFQTRVSCRAPSRASSIDASRRKKGSFISQHKT